VILDGLLAEAEARLIDRGLALALFAKFATAPVITS
jgi:hypothetical protein